MKIIIKFVLCLIILSLPSFATDNNWPRWGGPQNNGSAFPGNYPVKWGAERIIWKAEVPGKGCSTPIVWNHTIYLTTGAEGLDTVLAFDWSGKKLWKKTLGPEVPGRARDRRGGRHLAAQRRLLHGGAGPIQRHARQPGGRRGHRARGPRELRRGAPAPGRARGCGARRGGGLLAAPRARSAR